jgi:F0F1-type ATP synthase assembly protein I
MPDRENEWEIPKIQDHDLPDLPSAHEAEIEQIAAAAREARERQRRLKPRTDREMKSEAKSARGLGIGLTVAYTIIGLPIAGFLIGLMIDRQVGGTAWQTWLTLSLTFAGVFLAARILARHSDKL